MFNKVQKLKEYAKELKVLFVEDNEDARKFTYDLLSRFFDTIDTAQNGLEGLAAYNNNAYDIVLTDINMPEMNGIEMTKKIREINPEQKIMAISAHNESHILLDLVRSGFNGFVLKPIEPEEFIMSLYPIVRDAYTQKLNLELIIELNEQREQLKQQMHELQSKNRTIDIKHQQIGKLISENKRNKSENLDKDSEVADNFDHEKILLLADHAEDLSDIFADISTYVSKYIKEPNESFIFYIHENIVKASGFLDNYTPFVDTITVSLNKLALTIQKHPEEFKQVLIHNPEDILSLFDALSYDMEHFINRFKNESIARKNTQQIHLPTALSIMQIIEYIMPRDNVSDAVDFF